MPNFKHLSSLVASFGYFPLLVTESNVKENTAKNNHKFNVLRTAEDVGPYSGRGDPSHTTARWRKVTEKEIRRAMHAPKMRCSKTKHRQTQSILIPTNKTGRDIATTCFLFVTLVPHSTSRATAATATLARLFIFNKISYNKSNYRNKPRANKHGWDNIHKGQSKHF